MVKMQSDQDQCATLGLMPFEQALNALLTQVEPKRDIDEVSIAEGHQRVLAQPIFSPVNVPPTNNSAMDGYAFALSSIKHGQRLEVVGKVLAGSPYSSKCLAGQCVRIMTGGVIPDGCDTVVMQENCHVIDDEVILVKTPDIGANIRLAGEDIKNGAIVFESGRKLSTVDIGVLASLGIEKICVYSTITVALITTGDELKLPGEQLNVGEIYESNSQYLTAMFKRFGAKVINFGIVPDNKAAIAQAFEQANSQADVVVSCGGVSVGEADYTKIVLEELGQINFWKVAVKPGKPFAFGQLSDSYFFGLPGNPVSALVTAHQLVLPALAKIQNATWSPALKLSAITATSLRKSPGRLEFQRGVAKVNESGELEVFSTGKQGSGILTSMAMANCYIILPAKQGNIAAGESVTIQLFDEYLK